MWIGPQYKSGITGRGNISAGVDGYSQMAKNRNPEIQRLLDPGEEVLWAGKPLPDPGYLLGRVFIVICVFGIAVLGAKTGRWFTAVGFGFGGVLITKETIVSESVRRATRCVLSNRRAWILSSEAVKQYPLQSLEKLGVGVELAGKGKIYAQSTCHDWPHRDDDGNPIKGPLFGVIRAPQRVYSMLIECRSNPDQPVLTADMSNDELQIRDWLLKDERLLWTGRSLPRMELTKNDFLLVLLIPLYGLVAWNIVEEAIESRSVRREGIGAVSEVTLWLLVAGCAAFISIIVYGAIVRHIIEIWRRKTRSMG